MQRKFFLLIGVSLFMANGFAAPEAMAGEILRETPASDFKWRSTECRKPIQNKSSAISYQDSLERYARDITSYLGCLQREAQQDFEDTQAKMLAAIEKELEAETDKMDEMIKQAYRAPR